MDLALIDPPRNLSLRLDLACAGDEPKVDDILTCLRQSHDLDARRLLDGLLLLDDDGNLGDRIPGLTYRRTRMGIEIDRSATGSTRNWRGFFRRRWGLREPAYRRFVESSTDGLACDSPDRARQFLATLSRRIFDAPYETYSRYLAPAAPFRSPDQALDAIIAGDGGNCAEKLLALELVLQPYGFRTELVLGGESASGKFPQRALRSILDRKAFHEEATRDAQRHWQHYALLCRHDALGDETIFIDVAGSNIPFLFWNQAEASPYLDGIMRHPLPVTITLDTIPLYYHRIPNHQDIARDLYYAMEYFIPSIDLIHTLDNELGLVHTGDIWVGAFLHQTRSEFEQIGKAYDAFVLKGGKDPARDLCITPNLFSSAHPLAHTFKNRYPEITSRLVRAEPFFRKRIQSDRPGSEVHFAILALGPGRMPKTPLKES